MRAFDLTEPTLGSAMDFDVAASSVPMEAIVILSSVLLAAFIVGLCNSFTSVFAGLVVFAILGNLAGDEDIDTVVNVT